MADLFAPWQKMRVRKRFPASRGSQDRPILPWRIVAGGFLHFVLPAYLVALLAEFVVVGPATAAAWLGGVLPFSGRFLLAYVALAIGCSGLAALADPWLRARKRRRTARAPADDAGLSRQQLARAIGAGRGALGVEAAELLRAMELGRWDHDDPRFQALARDLDEVVRTSTTALRTAPADRRAAIAGVAAATLRHLDAARRDLEADASREDEHAAHTAARYVELRYGSDFSRRSD
jgi:hypothetical protein